MESVKCECPERSTGNPDLDWMYRPEEEAGRIHEPGECRGTFELTRYRRSDDSIAVLCSCCCFPTDTALEAVDR